MRFEVCCLHLVYILIAEYFLSDHMLSLIKYCYPKPELHLDMLPPAFELLQLKRQALIFPRLTTMSQRHS
jgi:hypothetical protein